MTTKCGLILGGLLAHHLCWGAPASAEPNPSQVQKVESRPSAGMSQESEMEARADKRYEEMLGKMQAAVEEIAQLYGNPVFLQVFTNDVERASELKRRLRSEKSGADIQRELVDLERKRDNLLNDIALREREASRLSGRLVLQRAALDALAAAIEQARKAVEETTK